MGTVYFPSEAVICSSNDIAEFQNFAPQRISRRRSGMIYLVATFHRKLHPALRLSEPLPKEAQG